MQAVAAQNAAGLFLITIFLGADVDYIIIFLYHYILLYCSVRLLV